MAVGGMGLLTLLVLSPSPRIYPFAQHPTCLPSSATPLLSSHCLSQSPWCPGLAPASALHICPQVPGLRQPVPSTCSQRHFLSAIQCVSRRLDSTSFCAWEAGPPDIGNGETLELEENLGVLPSGAWFPNFLWVEKMPMYLYHLDSVSRPPSSFPSHPNLQLLSLSF